MEYLKDPKKDRVYNKIPLPRSTPLQSSEIWDNEDLPNLPNHKKIKRNFREQGMLKKVDIIKIISLTKQILSKFKK